MRTILMVLTMLGLMSTVGVYAASFGGGQSVSTIGGTGTQTVSSPTTSSVDLSFTITAGKVSAAKVSWTPTATGNYTIAVDLNGTTYMATGQAGVASTLVTHTVAVSPSVNANAVTNATVVIASE